MTEKRMHINLGTHPKTQECGACNFFKECVVDEVHRDNKWIYYKKDPYYNMPFVVLREHRVYNREEFEEATIMAQRLWGFGVAMEMNGYDAISDTWFPHGFFYYEPWRMKRQREFKQILESVL